MGITKERLEHELKAAEEQIERVKADANVAIGHALGKRDLLKMQLAFLEDQEKEAKKAAFDEVSVAVAANSAQADIEDAHPLSMLAHGEKLRRAKDDLARAIGVAEAAVS